jgi:peptide/nickel transport system substrate-binding protein
MRPRKLRYGELRRGRLGLGAAGAAIALLALAACAPSAPSASGGGSSGGGSSSTDTLTIATTTDIDNYNPLIGDSTTDFWINDLMYPALMSINANGSKVPAVATSWGYTSPTQGYFDIRSGMKWSDGVALTAEDVAWELNAIIKYQPAGIITGFIGNLKSATATSPTHVELTLSKPDSTLIPEIGFWMPIVPMHIWDKVGDIGKYVPNKDWVSAGPYKLVSAVRGQSYTMDRVTPYPFAPGGKPTMAKVVFQVYPDVNTEILALKSGAVDVIANTLPPSQVPVLQKTPGITVQSVPGLGYNFLTYNVTQKPLNNVLVREALAHAVDDSTLRQVVLDGEGVTTGGVPIAPVLKQWVDPSLKEYSFDPALSRSLLKQAGYTPNSSGQFPLSFTLVYSLQDPVTSGMVPLIRSEAAQAGITINLKGEDRNTFLQAGVSGSFDIYASSFSIEDNPIIGMELAFEPKGTNNYTFDNNPRLNSLLASAATAPTMAQQVSLVHQAAQLVQSQVYDNVLFMQDPAVAYKTGWTGWKVEPSQLLSIINPLSLANVKYTG